jgi:hypothetical protein
MTSRIWAVAIVAAVAGATAGAHPAGWRPADVILTGALAGLVTLAGSRSGRWAWLAIAGAAVVVPSAAPATACAVIALVLALTCVVLDRRSPLAGAAVAGLAVQALLRTRGFAFFGAPSIVAGLAMLPVLVSGYRAATGRARKVVRRAVLVTGGLALVCVGLAVVAGVQARTKIQQAIHQAQAGFDAAQNGDRDTATAQLTAADQSFASVSDQVDSWWARPVRAVPVAGQQMAVVQAMAEEGHQLARTASTGVATIDYDRLRLRGGAIDLALLHAAQQPISDAVDSLDAASHRLDGMANGWLVVPIRDRYDQLQREISKALPPARNARDAVAIGPEFLGATAPKHYVVLFGTPSESRELGGLVGNYAEVTADQGKLTLTRTGRSLELSDRDGQLGRTLQPGPYLERYSAYQVLRFFQNVSASPDFPEVADVTQQVYPQAFGQPVDGVFYMDPYALAGLLSLTGPVTLPDSGVTLDKDNAARVLLVDQYASGESPERLDFLDEATRLTFEKLTSGDLPKPASVTTAMDPVVEQGRMLAFSPDPKVEALFRQLGLDGAFPDRHEGDFLSVTQTNAGANKIDAYEKRAITYDASYRPDTGDVSATLTVTLTNEAPASGLSDLVLANIHGLPPGTNQALLTVYSPLALDTATIAGLPLQYGSIDRFGVHAYVVEVDIPPGASQVLELHLHGAIRAGPDYELTVARQATVNPDRIDVRLSGTRGWTVQRSSQMDVESGTATATLDDTRVQMFGAHFTQ